MYACADIRMELKFKTKSKNQLNMLQKLIKVKLRLYFDFY